VTADPTIPPRGRDEVLKNFVTVPKEFFVGPIFAATPQAGPRTIASQECVYQIGGFHPLDPAKHPPALDVRHARALFALLSFRSPFDRAAIVRFSMRQFCQRYAASYGGAQARRLRALLGDLLDTYLRLQPAGSGTVRAYRLFERIEIEERPARQSSGPSTETWVDTITLSPEFARLLGDVGACTRVNLDSFLGLRSCLAQAIYLYLPSRACHRTEQHPFEITLSTLLRQVGHPIPETRRLRSKLFTQNRTSIIEQLDGRETLTGILRVRLSETADGTDGKLQAWVERKQTEAAVRPDGKMIRAFLASGRTTAELDRRLAIPQRLDTYELDLLHRGEIAWVGNERFFTLAKALLGTDRFQTFLAEAKGDALEGRKPTKNPTSRLIYRIMQALQQG
jgi:head-tail adaptor